MIICGFFTRFIEEISPDVVEKFRDSAKAMVEKLGAVDAVAAALAHISNTKEIKSRSLLTGKEVCTIVFSILDPFYSVQFNGIQSGSKSIKTLSRQ